MTRLMRLAVMCAICAWGPVALAQTPDPATASPATTAQPAASPQPTPAAPAERPTRAELPRPTASSPAAAPAPESAPAPGEERVTRLDPTEYPCDSVGHNPGFRLGQDQVARKGDAYRNLVVVFGNVLVEGHVCGDLSVTLGDVRLASGASVEGTLVVVGGKVTIEPTATVGQELVLVGGTLDAPEDFRPGREQIVVGVPVLGAGMRQSVPYITRGLLLGRLIVPDIGWVWGVVAVLFFVQLLLNLLFPRATAASARIISERPLSTFMAGVLVLVLTGPVVALLAVTVIGLAVVPVLFGALLIAWIVGKVAVNRWIGTRLFEQDDMDSRLESTRSFAIGFVIITILYMIPLLGLVVWGLSGVLGLGAATLAFVRGYRRENPPTVRAPRETPPVPPPPVAPSPFEAAALGATPVVAGGGVSAADADSSMHRSGLGEAFTMPPPAFAGGVSADARATTASAVDPRVLLTYPRAGFGERAAAFALDALLVGMLVGMSGWREPGDFYLQLLVAYHMAFWFWKATTLGGIICQLRVVRVDAAPLRFVDVLVRGLVGVFSIAAFGLGGLWILRDPERQSWHDKVAGTVVVKVPKHYPLP
jgi:uncharacterized RDD family membrane protein YckC